MPDGRCAGWCARAPTRTLGGEQPGRRPYPRRGPGPTLPACRNPSGSTMPKLYREVLDMRRPPRARRRAARWPRDPPDGARRPTRAAGTTAAGATSASSSSEARRSLATQPASRGRAPSAARAARRRACTRLRSAASHGHRRRPRSTAPSSAFDALAVTAEPIADEWQYVTDLDTVWRARLRAVADARGDRARADPATEDAIEALVDGGRPRSPTRTARSTGCRPCRRSPSRRSARLP